MNSMINGIILSGLWALSSIGATGCGSNSPRLGGEQVLGLVNEMGNSARAAQAATEKTILKAGNASVGGHLQFDLTDNASPIEMHLGLDTPAGGGASSIKFVYTLKESAGAAQLDLPSMTIERGGAALHVFGKSKTSGDVSFVSQSEATQAKFILQSASGTGAIAGVTDNLGNRTYRLNGDKLSPREAAQFEAQLADLNGVVSGLESKAKAAQ